MSEYSFSGIPVNIDPANHEIYDQMVSRAASKAEESPFSRMPDLFMLAACIGASRDLYSPLESKGREIFSGEAFDQDLEVPILAALAFKKAKRLDILLEPKEVVEIAQGWANGGLEVLRQELLEIPALNPLDNLVELISREIDLDFATSAEAED